MLCNVQIPKNLFLARRMFVKAVEKNHVLAAFQLAKLYHLGWGGEKDLCKASSMYKVALPPDASGRLAAIGYMFIGCEPPVQR